MERRRTTKEKEKERVPNSRFERDAAGGVVQLRKHVKFEMSNFRDEVVCFRSPQSSPQISWKMSNVEFRVVVFRVVVCCAVAKHRISPAESRWALRREGRSLHLNFRDEVDDLNFRDEVAVLQFSWRNRCSILLEILWIYSCKHRDGFGSSLRSEVNSE